MIFLKYLLRSIGGEQALNIPLILLQNSANHKGDINRAFRIMEEAKQAGADAIKLQTHTQDTITMDFSNEDLIIRGEFWDGNSLYELYKKAHFSWDWHKTLFEKVKDLDITTFNSPSDNRVCSG